MDYRSDRGYRAGPMTSRAFLVDSHAGQIRCMAYLMAIGWGTPHVVTISDGSGPVTERDLLEFKAVATFVAEQVAPQGRRFNALVWRKFYVEKFIGAVSPEALSRREFAAFLLQVRSHAASELGVVFPLWE